MDVCIEHEDRGIWSFYCRDGNPTSPAFWATVEDARAALHDVVDRYPNGKLRIVRVKTWIGDQHVANHTVTAVLVNIR